MKYKKISRVRRKKRSTRGILGITIGLVLFLLALPLSIVIFNNDTNTRSNAQIAIPQPIGQAGGWNMIFNDEFDGTSLDTAKWVTCYAYSLSDDGCAHSNGELQWYLPKNVILGDGTVKLRGQKEVYNAPDGKTYNYTSGMITTGRNKWDSSMPAKFKYLYGYAEMRAMVPKGKGFWPAFWMLPFSDTDPGKWPPEIDIMEILGNNTTTIYTNYHWNNSAGVLTSSGAEYTGPDFASDFHTYAVDWQPDALRWYVDGVERRLPFTDTAAIPHEPMHIIANLAIGGTWPGAPDATTVFPNDFEIDYIRVWQKCTTDCPVTATPPPPCSGITVSTPLSLDKTTVAPGEVINGTITYKNNCSSAYSVKNVLIFAQQPNGTDYTHIDFLPQGGAVTLQPGQTITVSGSITIPTTAPVGQWFAAGNFQDTTNAWHEDPDRVYFSVANRPTSIPTPTQVPAENGLNGSYFANKTLSGSPTLVRVDPTINFTWAAAPAPSLPADNFSVRWTGYFVPKYSETYTFYTQSDDGVRLWVNDIRLINNWTNHSSTENSGKISLTAGKKYPITMEYYENRHSAVAKLSWRSPSQQKQIIPQSQLFTK